MFGFSVDCLRRFSVISVWGRSKSHKFLGKLGTIPDKVDRKRSLKVRIARFSAFIQMDMGWYQLVYHYPLRLDDALVFST